MCSRRAATRPRSARWAIRSRRSARSFPCTGPPCAPRTEWPDAMKCPFCSAEDTQVIDSRVSEEGDSIRRRRRCQVCYKRFTTYETVGLHDLRHAKLGGLVGREALVAHLAAAPAADGIALLAHARVDDLRVLGAAEGAFHGVRPFRTRRALPARTRETSRRAP